MLVIFEHRHIYIYTFTMAMMTHNKENRRDDLSAKLCPRMFISLPQSRCSCLGSVRPSGTVRSSRGVFRETPISAQRQAFSVTTRARSDKKLIRRQSTKPAFIDVTLPPRSPSQASRSESAADIDVADLDVNEDSDDDFSALESNAEYFGERIYEAGCRQLGIRPIQHITQNLRSKILTLRHCTLHPEDVKPLAVSLVGNCFLNTLDLCDNKLGVTGATYIADVLRENIFLTHVDLSENNLQSKGLKILCDVVVNNTSLQSLKLSGNTLTDGDAECINRLLKENVTLKHLDLSHNKFGAESGATLGSALEYNETLTSLDLSWNQLRLEGAEALCLSLKNNIGLKTLNLGFNGLSVCGCNGLKTSLAYNKTLTELDISYNRIADPALDLLLSGLASNSGLQVLKMGNNPISISKAVVILATIKENTTSGMKHLDLSSISVDVPFVKQLKSFQRNHPLAVIHDKIYLNPPSVIKIKDNKKKSSLEDPLFLLVQHMKEKNLRLVDIFHSFDADNSLTVDKNEFIKGLQEAEINVPEYILDKVMSRLDLNGDGEIDFLELVKGYNSVRRKVFKEKMRRMSLLGEVETVPVFGLRTAARLEEKRNSVIQDI